jgi:hypothetical protein
MARKPAPYLSAVSPEPGGSVQPSCKLGPIGMSLWRDVLGAYEFSDRASYETLAQACAAADRAERCRAQIDEDGELLRMRSGAVKDHPLLKHELAARSFVVRSLSRLGLDLEPVRAGPGRPPGLV